MGTDSGSNCPHLRPIQRSIPGIKIQRSISCVKRDRSPSVGSSPTGGADFFAFFAKRDSRKPIDVSFYANTDAISCILFLHKKGQIASQSVPIYIQSPRTHSLCPPMPHSLSKKGHCALPSISFTLTSPLFILNFSLLCPPIFTWRLRRIHLSVYSYLRRLTFDIARVAFAIAVSDRHVRPFANMSCL